jgi:hypothetical protein
MATKKTTGAKRGSGKPNKSAFVRSLPETTPAKDVVELGKAQGMKLTAAYVYSIRTAAKAGARKQAVTGVVPRRGRPARAVVAARLESSAGHRVEELLRAVAAELGLSRAIGLLQSEQQKVRAVLGG